MAFMLIFQIVLLSLTLILIVVIASVKVGAWWLRLAMIDLLATMLLRRIDAIGSFSGVELISDQTNGFITLLALWVMLVAFIAARQRHLYWMRAEEQRKLDEQQQQIALQNKRRATIDDLERMREESEKRNGINWKLQTAFSQDSLDNVLYQVRDN
jgi:hypothetical protein